MRPATVLVPIVLVITLAALATLPSGYAQSTIGSTSQYLPVVFKAPPTPTATLTPTPAPQLANGDFEQGDVAWNDTGGVYIDDTRSLAHSGTHYAVLSSILGRNQTLSQRFQIPSDRPILSFWSKALSARSVCSGHTAGVAINQEGVAGFEEFCISGPSGYQHKQIDLSRFAGQVVDLAFVITRSDTSYSSWSIDDVSFEASVTIDPTATPVPTRDPSRCAAEYPTVCIPPPPPDLNCPDITYRNFRVNPPDRHKFDTDNDGIGCET